MITLICCFFNIILRYISSDFQISILLPLVLIPLYKSPGFGKTVISLITILTAIIPIIIKKALLIPTYDQVHMWPNFLKYNLVLNYNYQAFWNYIPAYLIGILLGRILFKSKQYHLGTKMSQTILLVLSVAAIGILFWMESFDRFNDDYHGHFANEHEIFLLVYKFVFISPF